MNRVAITGASGFIGSALARELRNNSVSVLGIGRGTDADITWDPSRGVLDTRQLENVDAVVHLAGAPIARRWTAHRKREIRESRVQGTLLIARAVAELARPDLVLVNASAIGYYGDRGDDVLTETSDGGTGFLADVVRDWEGATERAALAGVRVVHARTGIVLAPGGGALKKMLPPFRFGFGGPIGSGQQWMSWIALSDHVRALAFLIAGHCDGAVNLVAPNPVKNDAFAATLSDVLSRPAVVRAPAFALRAVLGEMANETVLVSQRVLPARLSAAGFTFRFPGLEAALRHELNRASD